ncbi:MAG: hypothetical protein K9N51_02600 [Candidatus Pacebacteria bacterium]|nr:hypothetical protein [Candidatus Paceibacterota bacterium]
MTTKRELNAPYSGEYTDHIAFPLGGIGAGMICLTGVGGLSHVSIRHRPEIYHEPELFGTVAIKGVENGTRVLEGPVPNWKIYTQRGAGNGLADRTYGLPRFEHAVFRTEFPLATVTLTHPTMPIDVSVVGWSPFIPGDSDSSSLPVAALEYQFTNRTEHPLELTFGFHAANFLAMGDGKRAVQPAPNGFSLHQQADDEHPEAEGAFRVECDHPNTVVDCAWFRGGWFDAKTILWRNVCKAEPLEHPPHPEGDPGRGASLYTPVKVAPGATETVRLRLCWYVPRSSLCIGEGPGESCCNGQCSPAESTPHIPWYATQFKSIDEVARRWQREYEALRQRSEGFHDALYGCSLPPEVIEAVAANLTILKSPTVLRQHDGRLWAWEGCCDEKGCCAGSCTHVWNYAQALCHLFPDLERSLRTTEFGENQDEHGHQNFRANLPIRPMARHDRHAAADGQLGGIMKMYRDWRISGDHEWMRTMWPRVKQSLEYCIKTWDPDHTGTLVEPHHNTYDIEFWGPDGMCTSFYLGALEAARRMAESLEDDAAATYRKLHERGKDVMEKDLFNGEYFIQHIRWEDLRAPDPTEAPMLAGGGYSPEARRLLEKEGPKYQYGNGCLSDGVLGAWLARVCGLGDILDPEKVRSHLLSVHRHNFRPDLSDHANPQRPTYALGHEAGLLLCSWPKGGELSLPFVYSNEVWTGIEYQVAGHLIFMGCVEEGLEIVRAARSRYDGKVRNPFDEYECGHWYARALSSYGLLQALGGAWYDAADKTLDLTPTVNGDYAVMLSTATGYGTAGIRDGKPFVDVREGTIDVSTIRQ